MTVGLIRSEAAGDLRTLTATGATGRTRRTLTAATAGALALLGALLGVVGAYLALAATYHDDLGYLGRIPALPSSFSSSASLWRVPRPAGYLRAASRPPSPGRQSSNGPLRRPRRGRVREYMSASTVTHAVAWRLCRLRRLRSLEPPAFGMCTHSGTRQHNSTERMHVEDEFVVVGRVVHVQIGERPIGRPLCSITANSSAVRRTSTSSTVTPLRWSRRCRSTLRNGIGWANGLIDVPLWLVGASTSRVRFGNRWSPQVAATAEK